jgi:hypothetical protein
MGRGEQAPLTRGVVSDREGNQCNFPKSAFQRVLSPDSPTRPRPETRLLRLTSLRGGRGGPVVRHPLWLILQRTLKERRSHASDAESRGDGRVKSRFSRYFSSAIPAVYLTSRQLADLQRRDRQRKAEYAEFLEILSLRPLRASELSFNAVVADNLHMPAAPNRSGRKVL